MCNIIILDMCRILKGSTKAIKNQFLCDGQLIKENKGTPIKGILRIETTSKMLLFVWQCYFEHEMSNGQ